LRRQFHFEMAFYACSCQVALYIFRRKYDAAAIVSNSRYCFGDALIDRQELVVSQVDSEADNVIGHEKTVPALYRHIESD